MKARQLCRDNTVNRSIVNLLPHKFDSSYAHFELCYKNPCYKDFLCIALMHILVIICPTFTLLSKALSYYGTKTLSGIDIILPLLGEVAESRRGIDKNCERGRNSREVLR